MTTPRNNESQDNENSSRPNKRNQLFVTYGTVLNVNPVSNLRHMPLSLDDGLPTAVFSFGTNTSNEIDFSCHMDTCAAMNTANLLLHQWIITTYPDIVDSYEHFNDKQPFHPIELDCAVLNSDFKKNCNKLTAVVTYKTRYCDQSGKMITISFGLGESVSVNAIIGLPTLKELKMVLDVDSGIATSKLLRKEFNLSFQHAASGFPEGVVFDKADFVRPRRKTATGLALLCAASTAIAPSHLEPSSLPTVVVKDKSELRGTIQGNHE